VVGGIYVYFNCSDYSNQSDSTCEKWRIIGVFKNMTKSNGTKEDLVKFSNKLRTSVEDFDFDLGYKVTISLGATFFKENDTKDTIFKRTDEALYISKNSGRNIVTIV
jgi:GGDEF domain-containing protein